MRSNTRLTSETICLIILMVVGTIGTVSTEVQAQTRAATDQTVISVTVASQAIDIANKLASNATTLNGVEITPKIRAADIPLWKKGTLAVGDVFGVIPVPDNLTLAYIRANVITAPTGASITFAIQQLTYTVATEAPSIATIATNLYIAQNCYFSSVTTSIASNTWSGMQAIRFIVTGVGSVISGADLTVIVKTAYND